MDDMYKSIKAFLYDRTSSPLFGAFIISWSVINYRVILTIFSGEGLANKFAIIDQLYSVTLFEQSYHFLGLFYYGFMLPALATISYIYLYPLLAKPVYEHSLKKQKELREIKQKEEGNRLLSQGESREIYREMAEAENKYYLQEEKYRKQVAGLISRIQELEEQDNFNSPKRVDKAKDTTEKQSKNRVETKPAFGEKQADKLTKGQEDILMALKGTSGHNRKDIDELLDPFEENPFDNPDKLKYEADELVKRGFLGVNFDTQYFLTHKGRSYLVRSLPENT